MRRLGWAAGPGGLMAAGLKVNEAAAPPCIGIGIGIAIAIVMEGCRPRRPYARGAQGQRGRCPSTPKSLVVGLGRSPDPATGEERRPRRPCVRGHEGNEAVAPPRLSR